MKKITSKIPLALIALFILVILFIFFNQFDMNPPKNVYTEKDLGPTFFDKSNGFYLVFALAEPPEVNVYSDENINKYRRLFDPQFNNERFRFNWDIIAYRKMFHRYNEKARFINQHKKDWVTFARSNKSRIVKLKPQLSFLLARYEKLLACELVSDFSTPRIVLHPSLPQDHFYPYPGETALLTIARVYTALKILEAQEGKPDGLQGILAQTGFSKKLMASARTRYTNLLARRILCLSLDALNSLMNQKDCAREIFSRVFNGLIPLKYEDFGSRKAFIGDYLAAEEWVENKLENVKRHTIGGDAGRLFLQKNRTKYYYFDYVSTCIKYEQLPPFKWEGYQPKAKNLQKDSFWWLQNAVGKFIFSKDFKPDFQADILRSWQTKILYDLTRISAELHLNYTHDKPVKEILNHLESYRTPDPYSGKPYIWDKNKAILYSIGPNRVDDGGVYDYSDHFKEDQLDIAIPLVWGTYY